jgi:hypothetical protein
MTELLAPPRVSRSPGSMVASARRRHSAGRIETAATAPAGYGRTVLTGLFAISLATFACARVADVPNLALAGALGVLFLGVGTAPLQRSRDVSLSFRLAVAGVVGLSTALLLGAVMVLAPLWHPELVAIVVLAVAGAVHASAAPAALADVRRALAARVRGTAARALAGSPSFWCTLAGTALWLGSAILSHRIVPGIGGFLPRITPLWYAGLVLLLAAIALARRERHEAFAAGAVTSLALAFTLTPALLYGMPRSQSAAKHIELVRFVLHTHHLAIGDGIYAAYSAFFAAVAWLCRLAHVSDPTGLATFWPVLMAVILLVELRFMFGQLIDGRYRRWAAITLVLLVDAIGADYFSPQSVGYVLGLGIVALAIASGRDIDRRVAGVALVAASCALAITHELSPFIIGGVLVVLGAFRRVYPRWVGLLVLAAAGVWALANYHVLGGYFSLASLGDVSNFAPPSTPTAPGLSRDPIVAASSHALLLGMLVLIGGALVAVARHRREGWAWAYLISAGVGLLFVAVNPYGNEGIFRAALFGIPWLAVLAVHAFRSPSRRLGSIAWVALTVGLLTTFLVASFGMDATNVMRSSDLQALRAFEREARADSYLLNIGFGDLPSLPPDITSSTASISYAELNNTATQAKGRPVAADLVALLKRYEQKAGGATALTSGRLYAIWSPVESYYAQEYGLERPGQSVRWRDLLLASPSWRVVYASHGTYLFQAVAAPVGTGSRR